MTSLILRNTERGYIVEETSGKVVAVSGGFDPVHAGHLSYIKNAMKLGDRVIVILSRNDQLEAKKGYFFMDYFERKVILEAIVGSNGVVVENIDENITSCQSLRLYKPHIFAKGGDTWDKENLPEQVVCEELGIKVVFGVGGFNKAQSSSKLVEKAVESHRNLTSQK